MKKRYEVDPQIWLRYAAAVLLLLGLGYGFLEKPEESDYAYYSEVEYGAEIVMDEDLADATFSKGKDYLSENSFLFSEEKLTEYQRQLHLPSLRVHPDRSYLDR